MGRAFFRFYAELNDHLPAASQYKTVEKQFLVSSTVKDLIESLGVPHAEVDLVVVNGESVDFSYSVRDGDRVAVYPMFEAVDITPALRLRPAPLRDPRFVLDVHLGKLAAYLRMLGFDTAYRNCYSDPELVRISASEVRILLTRDRGLLKHSEVTRGYWLRETDSRAQLLETVRRFDLAGTMHPFTRCMACNTVLQPLATSDARDLVPARVAEQDNEFRRCPNCGRVYWKGSHYERMLRLVEATAASGRVPR